MSVRVHVRVRGLVQGVYYRAGTREAALSLGLTGWVRNVGDGSVELVAEGERAHVEQLIAWCRRGPPAARVDGCELEFSPATGEFLDFAVRR